MWPLRSKSATWTTSFALETRLVNKSDERWFLQIFALEMPLLLRPLREENSLLFTVVLLVFSQVFFAWVIFVDWRTLTHINDAYILVVAFLANASINSHAMKKWKHLHFFNGCKFYFGCMNCMNSTCVLQLSPRESNAGFIKRVS